MLSRLPQSISNSGLDAINAATGIPLDLMLPDPKNEPAGLPELPKIAQVATAISLYLVSPVGRQLVFPQREAPAVPEVTFNKDGHHWRLEYEIRTSWQPRIVLAKSKPAGMRQSPND